LTVGIACCAAEFLLPAAVEGRQEGQNLHVTEVAVRVFKLTRVVIFSSAEINAGFQPLLVGSILSGGEKLVEKHATAPSAGSFVMFFR
jgi:hypothetical protein